MSKPTKEEQRLIDWLSKQPKDLGFPILVTAEQWAGTLAEVERLKDDVVELLDLLIEIRDWDIGEHGGTRASLEQIIDLAGRALGEK
jgi:hypothetical protein